MSVVCLGDDRIGEWVTDSQGLCRYVSDGMRSPYWLTFWGDDECEEASDGDDHTPKH